MVKVLFLMVFSSLLFGELTLKQAMIQTENDADFRTDRDYTYGSEIGVLLQKDPSTYISLSVAHQMFTPNDFDKEDVDLSKERPYAGYMYVGGGYHKVQGEVLESYNLQIGFVGESVKMDEVQKIIHSIIGSPEPKGWEEQIGDELIVQINYQKKYYQQLKQIGSFKQSVVYYGGFDLGNASTKVSLGCFYSFGNKKREDFGVSRIDYKSYNTIPLQDADPKKKTHSYSVNFWIEPIGVVRDIFLDGNSFKESRSVEKNSFVLKGGFGLSYRYGAWSVEYVRTYSTKEFKTQSYYHSYGSFLVGYNF